jgi:hypothetical protein
MSRGSPTTIDLIVPGLVQTCCVKKKASDCVTSTWCLSLLAAATTTEYQQCIALSVLLKLQHNYSYF